MILLYMLGLCFDLQLAIGGVQWRDGQYSRLRKLELRDSNVIYAVSIFIVCIDCITSKNDVKPLQI